MSADFVAGYISGAIGIVIGNPLDILKVKLQAGSVELPTAPKQSATNASLSFLRGSAAPVIGYGALNALLFMTYNRTLQLMDPSITDVTKLSNVNLTTIWFAGATGGMASWLVSAPSELIKCRAQLAVGGIDSSMAVVKHVWKIKGFPGFYYGGMVTSLRDSIGYGFYFWSYELCQRWFASQSNISPRSSVEVLISGGIAGVVTWASIYPLDVVKTALQAQSWENSPSSSTPLLQKPLNTIQIAKKIYKADGLKAFYRGFGVCSVRAFIVNAVQWFAYEKVMELLRP